MGVPQTQVSGASLVEVVIAFGIAATAGATAFTLIATLDTISARAQAECVVAQRMRQYTEHYLGMPYSQLQHVQTTSPTQSYSGYFRDYSTPAASPDWTMVASLTQATGGTGQIQIALELTWQDPKLGFPRSGTQNKTLSSTLIRPIGS
jgi:hypothetical protein